WKSHSLGELAANPLFLKYLLVGSFSILTLYIAANQLQKQANTAMVTALTELRKQLTSDRNRKMHFMLSPREEQRTLADTGYTVEKTKILTIDAFNYLGTLELGILIIPTLTGFKTLLG
ncbi:MAG: hypothetical protein LBJ57_02860, partial [Prevotellaceae bacterium]|nr:hypothetical protein [Prevotellaceae bacterium]